MMKARMYLRTTARFDQDYSGLDFRTPAVLVGSPVFAPVNQDWTGSAVN